MEARIQRGMWTFLRRCRKPLSIRQRRLRTWKLFLKMADFSHYMEKSSTFFFWRWLHTVFKPLASHLNYAFSFFLTFFFYIHLVRLEPPVKLVINTYLAPLLSLWTELAGLKSGLRLDGVWLLGETVNISLLSPKQCHCIWWELNG